MSAGGGGYPFQGTPGPPVGIRYLLPAHTPDTSGGSASTEPSKQRMAGAVAVPVQRTPALGPRTLTVKRCDPGAESLVEGVRRPRSHLVARRGSWPRGWAFGRDPGRKGAHPGQGILTLGQVSADRRSRQNFESAKGRHPQKAVDARQPRSRSLPCDQGDHHLSTNFEKVDWLFSLLLQYPCHGATRILPAGRPCPQPRIPQA